MAVYKQIRNNATGIEALLLNSQMAILSHINKIRDLCAEGEKEGQSSLHNATRAARAERLLLAEQKKTRELRK